MKETPRRLESVSAKNWYIPSDTLLTQHPGHRFYGFMEGCFDLISDRERRTNVIHDIFFLPPLRGALTVYVVGEKKITSTVCDIKALDSCYDEGIVMVYRFLTGERFRNDGSGAGSLAQNRRTLDATCKIERCVYHFFF